MCKKMRLTIGTVGVLQTEAGFVTLSHLGSIESQEVIVGEHLDTVVVPEAGEESSEK